MTRSNVGTTIERIRRQLESNVRLETNVVAANIDMTQTVITMMYDIVDALRPGTVLSIGTELFRVITVNTGSKEVTVRRAFQDSPASVHQTGDEVLISPRFTRMDIYDAIIAEIDSWTPELFRVGGYEWTVSDDDDIVELPVELADAIGVIALRRQWSDDDRTTWPTIDHRLMRGRVGTWSGATASGLLIRLLPNLGQPRNGTIYAELALPFDVSSGTLLESEDLVSDYELDRSMLEVVELGVKIRLMGDSEHGRSGRDTQDEPRRAEEVPAGSALTVAQTLRQTYARRRGDEQRRLQSKYKLRSW